MRMLVPKSDNLKQGTENSLHFLTNREGSQCLWIQFNLYLLSTFHAGYSEYKNKLTTVPQEVDYVVVLGKPCA